jgi:hypothetical protein
MSLLQKAVRRGHRQLALQAAASLLRDAPEKFWRRIAVIAYEDVGAGDLDAVGLVTASLGGKKVRTDLGGEWRVASFLIESLFKVRKCRANDDLLMVAERHPAYERARLHLTYKTVPQLLDIAFGRGLLPERALALWYALGTDRCPSRHLRSRKGAPLTVFDAMGDAGYPDTIIEIAREAFLKTNQVLCAFLPLVFSERANVAFPATDDEFPPEMMIGRVPSWALDRYSREGLSAIRRFLATNCQTAAWLRQYVPPAGRLNLLGDLIFAVEGGQMANRWRWPLAEQLREDAETKIHGPLCPDATDILALLKADLALLNEVRANV